MASSGSCIRGAIDLLKNFGRKQYVLRPLRWRRADVWAIIDALVTAHDASVQSSTPCLRKSSGMPFWPIANTPISSVEEAATQGVAMNNQHRATHQQPPSDWLKPAVQGETC